MSVQIDRALAILELLATEAKPLAFKEIVSHFDIPKSGCHRILSALVANKFIQQDPATQRYKPSLKISILGLGYLAKAGLRDICYPELRKLAEQTGELTRLAVLDYETLYFMSEVQGKAWALRYDANLGREAVLHATAAGKAWLATLSPEEATRIVLSKGFGDPDELGPNAIRSVEGLLHEFERTRQQGVGIAREELEPGINAVSAAIVLDGTERKVVGCVIVVAPSVRMSEERIKQIIPFVKGTAERIGKFWPLGSYASQLIPMK